MARLGARVPARRILGLHPGAILAVLDTIGLAIASYLSIVELSGGVPVCPAEGVGSGCAAVALSEYSKIGGLPVAVYGVGLSLILLTLALVWWRRLLGRDLPQAWPQPFANGAALAFALGLTRLMFAR